MALPRNYNKETADKICARIARGEYVRDACKEEGYEAATIYGWLNYEPDFAKAWEIALKEKADILMKEAMQEMQHPIDDDIVDAGKGMRICNGARVNRSKMIVEKLTWWAAKCDKSLSDKDVELEMLKKQVAELVAQSKKDGK